MAFYKEDIADVELNNGQIYRSFLSHTIGEGDNLENRFGVRVFRNGEPEDIGGTCIGLFIRSSGDTVAITNGVVSGNMAYVTLPEACYAVEGQFALAIKCQGGGVTGTLRIIDGVVSRTTTETIVDPGTIIPSIEALIEEIETAVGSIPVDYSNLSDAVTNFNCFGEKPTETLFPKTGAGFTVSRIGDYGVRIQGTQTERAVFNLILIENNLPSYYIGGKLILFIDYTRRTTTYKIPFDIYVKTVSNPSLHVLVNDVTETTEFEMPSDVTYILLRLDIPASAAVTLDDDFVATILTGRFPNFTIPQERFAVCEKSALLEPDLNKAIGNHDWLMISSVSYLHKPDDMATNTGFLFTRKLNNFHLQLIYEFTGSRLWKRRDYGNNGESWEGWSLISGGGGGGTVIENTYNITTSPHITTDSNGWLQAVDTDTASESGKTDMTGPIMSMLTETGYCHLGEGIFYVSGNIDMPAHSVLCGCGDKSVIRLLQSTTEGYCVKMQEYCTVKDVAFSGSYNTITPTTEGTRTAIRFSANYDGETDGDTAYQTQHCMIDNVWIRDFTGNGILCHNSSINYARGLYASNVYIYNCHKGINIDYYSEFNKFTNVCISWCQIACVNNGGNNVFTACTFHARSTGFKIEGNQPNSAHGTINGCTFCHIGSNVGSAITMDNVTAGFVISNCQFWYDSIDLTNSGGIVFDGCEFGRGTTGSGATINITGGDLVMFTGCVFMNDVSYPPTFTITNNTKVKLDACYGSVSGNAITA